MFFFVVNNKGPDRGEAAARRHPVSPCPWQIMRSSKRKGEKFFSEIFAIFKANQKYRGFKIMRLPRGHRYVIWHKSGCVTKGICNDFFFHGEMMTDCRVRDGRIFFSSLIKYVDERSLDF